MQDQKRKRSLFVSREGTAGPYIVVPVSQLDAVRHLLIQHGIPHTVDEYAISLDGEPEVATVELGRSGDAERVQQILDSVA